MPRAVPLLLTPLTDLALGLSLGMYYTITYFGRTPIPLPGVNALGAPLLYYVVINEETDTTLQAWVWMICFPVAALIWRGALWAVARALRAPTTWQQVAQSTWHTSWPLLLPIPALVLALGTDSGAFTWPTFLAACLRRSFANNPAWLVPVFLPLALLTLALLIFLTVISAGGLSLGSLWTATR